MNICKWVSLWCHRLYFVHRNDKNPIFQLWESKTSLISTLNKCRWKNVCSDYFDMGTCFHMFEQKKRRQFSKFQAMSSWSHSFVYSYWLFKKCFVENYENSNSISYFLSDLHQIFTVLFEMFYSFYWINLNLDWIPL